MDDDIDDADSIAMLRAAEQRHRTSSAQAPNRARPPPPPPPNAPAANASAANAAPKVAQPTPRALPQRSLPSAILVSTRQKGNPILNHISGVPWEYTDAPADYVLGQTTCALFLSLKYHRLHPEYIYSRIRGLAGKYTLRVLLCMVDIDNHEEPLRELAKTSLVNDLTLILAWSAREAARYLEAYKAYERGDATGIKGARAATFAEHMTEFVTTPRGVNKTDAVSLVGNFGSVRNAVNAERDLITAIPGWGEKKVDRFLGTVNESFRVGRTTRQVGRQHEGVENEPLRVGMLKAREVSDIMEQRRQMPDSDGHGTKRGRDEIRDDLPTWEPDEDENEALFVAENAQPESVVAPSKGGGATVAATSTDRSKKAKEPELSDGVKAALAKLRQQ